MDEVRVPVYSPNHVLLGEITISSDGVIQGKLETGSFTKVMIYVLNAKIASGVELHPIYVSAMAEFVYREEGTNA